MAALDGMRILDLTQYEAGPSATQALAWLGADVVKVERPGGGDPGRGGNAIHDSSYFQHWNANKRSVALEMGTPEGRELFLRLVRRFDVVVENFGPGSVERLGVAYDDVAAVHPSVIYASVKGFGSSGPYAEYNCFDGIAMAMAGAFSVTGMADGPPLPPGPTMGDVGTGMQLALAICAAYIQRQRTGEGQRIELSMQEAMTYYLRTRLAIGGDWGNQPAPRTDTGRGALINLYACAPFGPNDYVYLMAVTDPFWHTLCQVMGRSDLAEDPCFADAKARARNADKLGEVISEWTAQRTKAEVMEALAGAGVPCGMVLDTTELYTDPHLLARGFVHHVDHHDRGTVPLLGWPARMSASSVDIVAAPVLGAHTGEVLRGELGLGDDEVAALADRGVIARG